MSDPAEHLYDFWHIAMAGGDVSKLIHDGDPQCGYYRRRMKRNGPFVAVSIFVHDGDLTALVDGVHADPSDIWLFCCRHPVSEEDYHCWIETGEWRDVDAGAAASLAPAPIGDNAPADPAEVIADQIETAKTGLSRYGAIADDEMATKAQSLRSRLLALSREADTLRKDEKEPFLEGGKAVDARYQPLVKDAKAAADTIAKALSAYETQKAREADKARREAEAEARKADDEAAAAKAAGEPAPAPAPAPEIKPLPMQVKGGYGRAATIKVVNILKEVTDQDALYAFLKDHKELIDLMEKLAQRAVNAGHDVPGVRVEEQRKVA